MDIILSTSPKSLTNDTTFSNYLLIDGAYSKITKLYGMENNTTAEVMDKLDMFQSIFGKIDQFGWWDLERITSDAGTHFTLMEFKDEFQTCGVRLTLLASEHQEMNGQVEVTSKTLRTVAHTLMVHARVTNELLGTPSQRNTNIKNYSAKGDQLGISDQSKPETV